MSDHEATLLEEHVQIALDELERASGLSIEQITELVEYGVFQPAGGRPHEWRFAARCIAVGRTASRLRADFELLESLRQNPRVWQAETGVLGYPAGASCDAPERLALWKRVLLRVTR